MKKFFRNCPTCGKRLEYASMATKTQSEKKNCVCVSCSRTGTHHSEKTKQKISDANKGFKLSDETKKRMSDARKGKKNPNFGKPLSEETRRKLRDAATGRRHTEETRKKISDGQKGKLNHNYGVPRTEDTKRKMRVSAINRIKNQKGQCVPNYNPSSIPILEQKAKELGITDLQHAENGGEFCIKELGYWVDGYSKEKNIVIEYYETFHKNRIEKDNNRKQEIINFLKCEFVEIEEIAL